jgi:hypothetical protein
VVTAAALPLSAKVEEALAGLDWSQSSVGTATPTSVVLNPAAVMVETAVLRGHAASLRGDAIAFQQGVQGLNF